MAQSFDLQSMILTLQQFWSERGCMVWQPYHTEVGAGTMNPATFLRVLGPEPWNVAYVEPSIRPDDGRYGENPNRLQQHYQFQVILKPDPGNPQEQYLQSLEALGIDLRKHDVRFVEDNWEQPALSAWGLGWQVWMDGQEISQYTYFQQAGGVDLDPVSVELTYGLERIAMPLQGVHHFRDIRWGGGLSYGDIRLQAEQEQSAYFFEVASIERLHQLFDLYEAEANAALSTGLVLPAQDFTLKCSHTFNVLDTRGAVGVTERQAYFGRIRDLARQVANAYVEQRQELEFPLLDRDLKAMVEPTSQRVSKSTNLRVGEPESQRMGESMTGRIADGPTAFLLEIGVEELPPQDLRSALSQIEARLPALLDELRLEHGDIQVLGTPRRIVAYVQGLAPRQPDAEELVKGPPADRAFDTEGLPTSAGMGFARSRGVRVDDLEVRDLDGGRYAVARIRLEGSLTIDVLSEALPGLLASLQFEKTMRWNQTNVAFSRPIRWLLAMLDEAIVPFTFAGLASGDRSRGLRIQEPPEFPVASPEEYFKRLEGRGIILDPSLRSEAIQAELMDLASGVKGEVAQDADLLADVTNEVESPSAVIGAFDADFLQLPREVLVGVMKKHQNYFPVQKEGRLLPYFLAVCNGDQWDPEVVTRGNEDVIRARFDDADFFIQNDRKRPLQDYLPALDNLMFQKDLGSMGDKTRRMHRLAGRLAEDAGLSLEEEQAALRAAELCKADLVTSMVVEMTSLQGVMGRYYALDSGETPEVARAIEEHYLPRYSGDSSPGTLPGLIVGLADKLDSLVGLFAAGLAPSGAKDPFALRRAALGLVGNLVAWDRAIDLEATIKYAADGLPIQAPAEILSAVLQFILERQRNLFLEEGYRYDVIDAVLAAQGVNPASAARAIRRLTTWVEREDWPVILPAYSRCVRITREEDEIYKVNRKLFEEPAERELYAALAEAEASERDPGLVDGFLDGFLPMIPAVNRFFDDVLVMVDDLPVRRNRLGLLQRVSALADGVADMSKLEGF